MLIETPLYFDRQFDTHAAKILPGEYYATAGNEVIVTVLGSCVSACLRDSEAGIGGMNHFMLPHAAQDGQNPVGESARYGIHAMEMLINELLKLGARRACLEAKLFGGGNVMPGFTIHNIGERNAEFALNYLRTESIRVLANDLLDVHARKVYFFPNSGRVLVRKLRNLHNDTILEREKEYGSRLIVKPVAGDVELFS